MAVWKQIKSLQEQGYPVESSSRGYRMRNEGDYLTDLEFSGEKDILFYRELNSTMDEAVRQIGRQSPTCRSFTVLADHQNAGIGRNQEQWDSPSGGIYLTFVLNDRLPLNSLSFLKYKGILTALDTMAAQDPGLKVLLSYSEEGGLFLKGRKFAGLLEEYQVRGDRILWYALGMGIHLNDTPPAPLSSVKQHCGKDLRRVDIIKGLKAYWDQTLVTDNRKIKERLEKNYVKR